MKFSLVSSILLYLATWQALAAVVFSQDETATTAVRQPSRRLLRNLDEFDFITEAPTMAVNETSVFPATAPDGGGGGGEYYGRTPAPTAASRGDDHQSNATTTAGNTTEGLGEDEPTVAPLDDGDKAAAGEGDVGDNTDEQPTGGDDEMWGGFDAPSETPKEGGEESPAEDESPAESPTVYVIESPAANGGDYDDEEEDVRPTPAPTHGRTRTEFPTAGRPTYNGNVPAPTYETPTYSKPTSDYPFTSPSYVPPTPKPYVSNDDENDPLKGPTSAGAGGSTSAGYAWDNSSVEELEHDQTVIIALSVVFGVMFLFSVIVAHQLLENPHGCCAR